MRIGLDFRIITDRHATTRGMGRYSQQQLREVLRLDRANEYLLVCRPDHDASLLLPEIAGAANVRLATLPVGLLGDEGYPPPGQILRRAAEFQEWIDQCGLDLFHATTPFLTLDPLLERFEACPLLATHYDLIPLIYDRHYFPLPPNRKALDLYLRVLETLRRADRLLAISDAARRDAMAYLGISGERIDVAWPIADPCFRQLPEEQAESALAELRRRTGLAGSFLLTVSHAHHSKNLRKLLAAYTLLPASWRRRHPLVLATHFDDWSQLQVEDWGRREGVLDDLVFPGFVADEELVGLYNRAHLVVHPSLYEGFGLPVLEAMQCGAAVIAARNPAISEMVGEGGLLVDPEDPAAFAAAIAELDRDASRRREIQEAAQERAASFTPRQLGLATLRCYERTVAAERDAENGARRPRRPRIALWGPLPPLESGIAGYTAELLPRLDRWAEIELFVDDAYLPAPELAARWPIFHHTAFARRHRRRRFDLNVYQMGSSSFHLYAYEALRRWPGLVVLHDLTWGALMRNLVRGGWPEEELRRELLASEGVEALREYDELRRDDPHAFRAELESFFNRHYMLRPLIEASRAQVVHLPRAARELSARYPGARLFCFEMGVEDPRASRRDGAAGDVRRCYGLPPCAFLIGAFGVADPVKRLAAAVRALARLAHEVPEAVLLVVGRFHDPLFRKRLLLLAAELGVAARVRLIEQASRGQFDRLLLACDVVINLRYPFRKQLSATLMRAAAAGKPIAVSDVPDWGHLPAGFCYRIRPDDAEDETLAAFIGRLAREPELALRMGRAARAYYLEHATVARMAESYRRAFEQVTGLSFADPGAVAEVRATLPHNKVCEVEDFRHPALAAVLDDLSALLPEGRDPAFPGAEERRLWELAMCVRALRDHGALGPEAVLLGVGAGSGLASFYLTRHARQVVATDRLLEFPDESFDGVFSASAIEHLGELSDVAAAAYEIGRVLKPGGIASISTELLLAGPPGASGWEGVLLFTPATLGRYVVEASGLEPVDELVAEASAATLAGPRDLDEAFYEVPQGDYRLPCLVQVHRGQVFASVHLALRKSARYPAVDNAWARPPAVPRRRIEEAAVELGERLREAPAEASDRSPGGSGDLAAAAAGAGIDHGPEAVGAAIHQAACAAGPAGSAVAGGGGLGEIAARFADWDAVRARTGLSGPVQASLPSRLAGFARRTLRRVRNLGIAWDRERELFAALVGELAAVEARLAAGAAERAALGGRLEEVAARLEHALETVRRVELVGSGRLESRLDELAVRQDALAMRLGRVAEVTPGRRVTTPSTAESGSGGPGGLAGGPAGEAAVCEPAAPGLTAGQLADLLAALERELPALGRSRAVEVSIQGALAEDLLAAANAHFGERMSAHGSIYREPNDAWLHVDFTAYRDRPILFENAAARLAPGGHFVLVTGAPAPAAEPHPDLRLAAARELTPAGGERQAPVQVMIWERR